MPNLGNSSDHCGKPGCNRDAEETYEGTDGNTVRVCGMHYYKLVTRGESETSPIGLGTDLVGRQSVTIKDTGATAYEPQIEFPAEDELNPPTESELRSE